MTIKYTKDTNKQPIYIEETIIFLIWFLLFLKSNFEIFFEENCINE